MSEVYAPDYLRLQENKQLHLIADMIEKNIDRIAVLEKERSGRLILERDFHERGEILYALQKQLAEKDAEIEHLKKLFESQDGGRFLMDVFFETRKLLNKNAELKEKLAVAVEALHGLLNDSQHSDHNCGDSTWCPVFLAKEALEKIKEPKS